MLKRPKSVTQIESAEIADILGAVNTAQAIRDSRSELFIVVTALEEMTPKVFKDFLKRTRDRHAAKLALSCINTWQHQEATPLLGALTNLGEEIAEKYALGRENGVRGIVRSLRGLLTEVVEVRRAYKNRSLYTDADFGDITVFIGNGNDIGAIEDVRRTFAFRMTGKQVLWLSDQLRVRKRAQRHALADALLAQRKSADRGTNVVQWHKR